MLTKIVAINPGKDGRAHLHVQYIAERKIKRWPTGIRVLPDGWDHQAQKLRTGSTTDVKADTFKLAELQGRLDAIIKDHFSKTGASPTTEYVAQMFESNVAQVAAKEKAAEPEVPFLKYLDDFMEVKAATLAPNSMKSFQMLRKHLRGMEAATKETATFATMDRAFLDRFQRYLIDQQQLNTTIAKRISTLKEVLNFYAKEGVNTSVKFRDFSVGRHENVNRGVVSVTADELRGLRDLDLSAQPGQAYARDLFVLSCLTGLRFSDLIAVRSQHVNGASLRVVVRKTRQSLDVPLNETARGILARYDNDLRPISIQKYNDHLKNIGQKVAALHAPITIVTYQGNRRLEETLPKYALLSSHTGRRTFATLMIEAGVPASAVMRVTGHTSLQMFWKYVNYRDASLDGIGGALTALDC